MNKEIAGTRYDQTSGGLDQAPVPLTPGDVQRIQGSRDKVATILQERYGYTRLQAEQRIADFLRSAEAELERPQQPDPLAVH